MKCKRFKFMASVLVLALFIFGGGTSALAEDYYRPWVKAQNLTVKNVPVFEAGLGVETSGDIWYVNSNATGTDAGTSWSNAALTIDAAINLAAAANGDLIRVSANHAETFSAANGFDCDKAGITMIFHGSGTNTAVLTFDGTNADVAIGAASCRILGPVRFLAGISEVVRAFSIEAGGVDFILDGAVFPEPTTSGFEFDIAISVASGAHRGTVQNVTAFSADETGASSWLSIETGVVHDWKLINNRVFGEYSAANVMSAQTNLEMFIDGGEYTNLTTGVHAIEFQGAPTGSINNVLLRTDTQGTTIDPGAMTVNNCMWDDEDTADTIAIPCLLATAGVASIGPVTSTTTDSIHGKIGSDADLADNSLYDLLGAGSKTLSISSSVGASVEGTNTDTLQGKIGTDAEMSDRSIWDMLEGDGFNSWPSAAAPGTDVSIAEVLRDVWDVLRAGTGGSEPGTNSSLVDILSGTEGIITYPAAAAPDDGVSMAEVIRDVWDVLRNGTGGAEAGTNSSFIDALHGPAGVITFPVGAVPDDGVSMAEVLRDIWDAVRNGTGGSEPGTDSSVIDAIGANGSNILTVTAGSLYGASGQTFIVEKTLISSNILTSGVDITGTASGGDILIEEIWMETDVSTGLATGTNFTIEKSTGSGLRVFFSTLVSDLGSGVTMTLSMGTITPGTNSLYTLKGGTVLESGGKLVAKCTGSHCDGAGTITLYIKGVRVTAGATLDPA